MRLTTPLDPIRFRRGKARIKPFDVNAIFSPYPTRSSGQKKAREKRAASCYCVRRKKNIPEGPKLGSGFPGRPDSGSPQAASGLGPILDRIFNVYTPEVVARNS